MSQINPKGNSTATGVYFKDGPNIDAFGRLRVSNPMTVFDSKQLGAHTNLFWDIAASTGSSSAYSTENAETTLNVATDGYVIRQTFMRFNYQAAKSLCITMTASQFQGENEVTKRLGYFSGSTTTPFNPDNGLFFSSDGYTTYETIAVNMCKAGRITSVPQNEWNIDKMNGRGISGYTVDWSKGQIYIIDLEWLGIGRVRFGLILGGITYYIHEFNNANNLSSVYMSTPNLPLRYEIRSSGGTGAISTMCCSIMSEGGTNLNGVLRGISSGTGHLDADVAGTVYAGVAIRLNESHLGATVIPGDISILLTTNDSCRWAIILNPTIYGNHNWTYLPNSCVDYVLGTTNNTVGGGTVLHEGWASASIRLARSDLESQLRLGTSIAGVRDVLVLAVSPISSNSDLRFAVNIHEVL